MSWECRGADSWGDLGQGEEPTASGRDCGACGMEEEQETREGAGSRPGWDRAAAVPAGKAQAIPRGSPGSSQTRISDRSHRRRMWSVVVSAQGSWQVLGLGRGAAGDVAFRDSPFSPPPKL